MYKIFNFRKLPNEILNNNDYVDSCKSTFKGPTGTWVMGIYLTEGFTRISTYDEENTDYITLIKQVPGLSWFKIYKTDDPNKFRVVWSYYLGHGTVIKGDGTTNGGTIELVKTDDNGNMNMNLKYFYPYTNPGRNIEENYSLYYNSELNKLTMNGNSEGKHLLNSINYSTGEENFYFEGPKEYNTFWRSTVYPASSFDLRAYEPIPEKITNIVKFYKKNDDNMIGNWKRSYDINDGGYIITNLTIYNDYTVKSTNTQYLRIGGDDPDTKIETKDSNGIFNKGNLIIYDYPFQSYNSINPITTIDLTNFYFTESPEIVFSRDNSVDRKIDDTKKLIIAKSIDEYNRIDNYKNNYSTLNINFQISIPLDILRIPIYILKISSFNVSFSSRINKDVEIVLFSTNTKKIPSDERRIEYINENREQDNSKVSNSNISLSNLFYGYNDNNIKIRIQYDGSNITIIWIKNDSTYIPIGTINNIGILNDNISFSIKHLENQIDSVNYDAELFSTNIQISDIYYN